MKLISQIVTIWQGGDGAIAEFIEDGSPLDAMDRFERVRALPAPAKEIGTYLLLEDGARFKLPFCRGRAYILPSRTGIAVVFWRGEYLNKDGSDEFPVPNNAAVFNADGSLRFQLENPHGQGTTFWGFDGKTFDLLKGTGEFRISVRDDDPAADCVHSFQYDGRTPTVALKTRRDVRL